MGKPKFSRKKYETPSHPWREERIKTENDLIKKYGLKNKQEIWKAKTSLRKYRGQARELLAKIGSGNPQVKRESEQLLTHLTRMNILQLNSNLDDVLALVTEPILSRRLQTLTYLKGLANTPKQARQLISHGHIAIGGRKTTVPSYLVAKDEENEISYFADSPLNDVLHPARPSSEFKPVSQKIDESPKLEKETQTEKKPEDEKPEQKKKEEPKHEEKPVKKEKVDTGKVEKSEKVEDKSKSKDIAGGD
ncbi:MAG: 30S ribosomal protein S4 [Candidatus Thermoplasmatota archaeon]|nr:30S ribosomal protein S4 [Candidatus Thermoplasmatota archaeon]